jgi:hypothetical protein
MTRRPTCAVSTKIRVPSDSTRATVQKAGVPTVVPHAIPGSKMSIVAMSSSWRGRYSVAV